MKGHLMFNLENIFTLAMLTLLQAVLGFDNLLYIALESKRAPIHQQANVRRWGIAIAVIFRIALLFALINLIQYFTSPILELHIDNYISTSLNLHSLIVLLGGIFILYTATKEIFHMITIDHLDNESSEEKPTILIIAWIVAINLVFSFDSILSAMALTNVFWIMALAIIIGGILMVLLADSVAEFLKKIECMKF